MVPSSETFVYVSNNNHFLATSSSSNLPCSCDGGADVHDNSLSPGPAEEPNRGGQTGSIGCAEPACNGCEQPTARLASGSGGSQTRWQRSRCSHRNGGYAQRNGTDD